MEYVLNELGEVAFRGDVVEVKDLYGLEYVTSNRYEIKDFDGNDIEVINLKSNKSEFIPYSYFNLCNVYSDRRVTLIGRYSFPKVNSVLRLSEYQLENHFRYLRHVDRGISLPPTELSGRINLFVGDTVVVEYAVSALDFRFTDFFNNKEPLTVLNVYYNENGRLVVEFCSERANIMNEQPLKVYGEHLSKVRVLNFNNEDDVNFVREKCRGGIVKDSEDSFSTTSKF